MARLSAEQALFRLKENGTFDALRQELQHAFSNSTRGQEFVSKVRDMLQWTSDERGYTRTSDKTQYLERRLLEQLEQHGTLERLGTDARTFWLTAERHPRLQAKIKQAFAQPEPFSPIPSTVVSRPLEIDPPRIPSQGAGQPPRSHSFYRRGDAVAAFVATCDPLCHDASYICLLAEIAACDAQRNAYTVRDADADGARQSMWVTHWDQLMTLKRPYEYTYRVGDQVYALYRDDSVAHTQVTTEFFPARIACVGPISLAVRYDSGELAHVYYDEVFAAGRVGFLRRKSEERRRAEGPAGGMVEVQTKLVPSFTGFWPREQSPALGKHGRKVRYRQMPPMLMPAEPLLRPLAAKDPEPTQSSDMDLASSPDPEPEHEHETELKLEHKAELRLEHKVQPKLEPEPASTISAAAHPYPYPYLYLYLYLYLSLYLFLPLYMYLSLFLPLYMYLSLFLPLYMYLSLSLSLYLYLYLPRPSNQGEIDAGGNGEEEEGEYKLTPAQPVLPPPTPPLAPTAPHSRHPVSARNHYRPPQRSPSRSRYRASSYWDRGASPRRQLQQQRPDEGGETQGIKVEVEVEVAVQEQTPTASVV
ncbi:hypothetical protein LPJ66_001105 [Kickxella alabastrina]|uniref:Uncharacterized protein n=1 Tax=Kickxella alabastrina TaxID=61397 RepID=A0ACC1IU60_9FUNG|nr:hypothetical protein LPJ66_001105 [Kickxella alabastrina]